MQYLYNLHEVAEKNGDGQMADFVEVMLEEQARLSVDYFIAHTFVLDAFLPTEINPCNRCHDTPRNAGERRQGVRRLRHQAP